MAHRPPRSSILGKTTFDLPESLLRDIKRIAKQRGTTARDLVQQALTQVVRENDTAVPFTLRDLSVSGFGLSPEFESASSRELRDAAYGDLPRPRNH